MHRIMLLVVLSASMGGFAKGAADTPHAHGRMGADRSAQTELGASATFDARGTLWAVHKVSRHIAVSRSEDAGHTWQNPVLVTSTPEPTDAGGDARLKIAPGPAGEIYLTWTKPLAKPYTGEIRYSRSLDGGRSFSVPAVVHRDRQEITHRFDTLAVNSRGQVFVVWIDKRDLAAAGDDVEAYAGAAVYFAVSDDQGATFRGDFKVADHACECCRITLAPRPDGKVDAMWRHVFKPNIRDHAVATLSANGQAGLLRRATFEEWGIDACPHHGPSLAADGHGRLHAVWFSGAPASRGVFYGQLRGGGVDALRRVGADGAANADVAVSGRMVAVAWKAFVEGRSWLRGMISADGGTSWREVELASVAGASDHPRVLTRDGRFHVFWNTAEKPLTVIPFP